MRKLALGIALAAAVVAAPQQAEAQWTLGPTLAWHDGADLGIGATAGFQAPFGPEWGFLADFIYFFPDGPIDYLEINGNVTYDFQIEGSSVVPFVLGGLNIARVSVDDVTVGGVTVGGGSSTDVGLNLGGGIDFDLGSFRPTAAAKFELSGGEGFVLWATLPFQVGG